MSLNKNQLLEVFFSESKDVSNKDQISKKLLEGNQIIKFGIDPTGSELHLGHLFIIDKLQILQQLENKIVIIIGDFTAGIGDPSGRDTTRPFLPKETIVENSTNLLKILNRYLDPNLTQYVYNSAWLATLTLTQVLDLATKVNVNQMLKRPDFKQRYDLNTSIQLSEFLYPLFQGYDSVVLNADLEIGGSDQLFNVQMGSRLGNKQDYVTFDIIEGIDNTSRKMSKTFNNHISLDLTPHQIYQKIINMPDIKIGCFDWLIPVIHLSRKNDAVELKKLIAFDLIKLIYNEETSTKFQTDLEKSKGLSFDFATELVALYSKPTDITLFTILRFLRNSKPSLKITDMVKDKQVKINEQTIDFNYTFPNLSEVYNIQLGKKVFIKLKFQQEQISD